MRSTAPTPVDRIHRLWDDLADRDPTHAEAAMESLLRGLCELTAAQNAVWVGAVRMGDAQLNDPVQGWRPRLIHHLKPAPEFAPMNQQLVRRVDAGLVDPSTVRNISFAGQFRANLLRDLVSDDWFDSDFYKSVYLDMGHHDAIWIGAPVTRDAESYFGLYRAIGQPRFTPDDRDTAGYTLRGLRWFLRQQMLAHGLLVASVPLIQAERRVLNGLLSGLTEKQIAEAQAQTFNTAHDHVKRLFRKYGVRNRAALMALWLGHTPD